MSYVVLASIFTASLLLLSVPALGFFFFPSFLGKFRRRFAWLYLIWFVPYFSFIVFFTGPKDLNAYPPQKGSPYKLPWESGVARFVAQGNRSFTSHRDFHEHAWDFVMPNGTAILAARDGRVVEVEDGFDGVGIKSNYVIVLHDDGERSAYAHIRHKGSLVEVGAVVRQGQSIALSGMVGQTVFPHLHFYVIDKDGRGSKPISFSEVAGGVPLAGRFYTSANDPITSR